MNRPALAGLALALAALPLVALAQQAAPPAGPPAQPPPVAPGAGPARIAYPKGFATDFVRYNVVDRFDTKRARFMYVDRAAAAAAKAGEALPDGIVVVMEDHEVELDAAGAPALDAAGRMKPTARVTAVAVMEKRKGWGELIPANLRNGDWDYASFRPDGSVNPGANYAACFGCHLPKRDRDFTFTTFINATKDGLKAY
jgi:hypothetical protein